MAARRARRSRDTVVGRPAPQEGGQGDKEGEGSEEAVEGEEGDVLEGGEGADDDEYEKAAPPPPPKTMATVTGVSPTLVTC